MPQTQIHPKKKKSTQQFLHSFHLARLIPFGLKKANEKKPMGLFTTPLIPKPKLPNQFSQKNHLKNKWVSALSWGNLQSNC